MILAAIATETFQSGSALPFHQLHGTIPLPWENHRLFGAGFLLVAVVLLVESLAGGVWHRAPWRRDIWPAVLIFLGWGLLAVALDPHDRPIHLVMGGLLIAAGVAERKYRRGELSLNTANFIVGPALLAGGAEVGIFHSHGAMASHDFIVHSLLGVTAASIAVARVLQAQAPHSMWRSAFIGVLVLVLALELLGLSHGDRIDVHGTQAFYG